MIGRAEYDQFILPPGNQLQFTVVYLTFNHTDVDVEVEHPGHHIRCVGNIQLHIRLWVVGQVPRQIPRRKMVADGETGAHFDMAYFSVVQQCLFETLAVCQQVFGFLAQGMPDGIQ